MLAIPRFCGFFKRQSQEAQGLNSDFIPITDLKEGEEGLIHNITGGKGLAGRLAGMGLAIGSRIKVLRKSGGLVLLLASDTRIALGWGEAVKILAARVEAEDETVYPDATGKNILVALVGQPNVGKSTVFNILTGLSQHVGNWPGKTVERKEGVHITADHSIRIIDLPGTYSLTAFSEEEKVARDFIINEYPEIVVLIVNAAALERSLYLLSELLLLGPPVIVAVNMTDVAEAQGIRVNIKALQDALGVPVVPMIARKNVGIRELVAEITALADGKIGYNPRMPDVMQDHKDIFLSIQTLIEPYIHQVYMLHWMVIKLMEGDPEVSKTIEELIPHEAWTQIRGLLIKHEDSLHAVVGGRYDWIEEVTRAAISRFKRGQVLMTDRIDHVLTRPVFGIPILLAVLAVVFGLTYAIGFPAQRWLGELMGDFSKWAEPLFAAAPSWVRGLMIDGIVGGVGSVLTFFPILLIFFAVMSFLEDIGYMARAAFVMDRFMHLIGLHGKSFIPMCLGFGCNVPAVLGARIIESKKARLLTIFLMPFIPCTARLAVLTFVCAAVFPHHAALLSWLIVTGNILLLGITGMLINKFVMKDEVMPFIMELPLYHSPDPKTIGNVIRFRTIAFIKRAGTVILGVSILIWLFSNLPGGGPENSILAWFGRFLAPAGAVIGLDWKMIVALLTSLIAKENAIATLGVLYSVGDAGLQKVLPAVMSPASAVAFLVTMMLFIPCAATIAVMRQEMQDRKWFSAALAAMLVISFIGGYLAYHLVLFL